MYKRNENQGGQGLGQKSQGRIALPFYKLKTALIHQLGGLTHQEAQRRQNEAIGKAQSHSYRQGYEAGIKKGKQRAQKTPGYLWDQVHRKLDLMFKKDKFSDRARYRWLKEHSLTTSHMSEMSYDELMMVNKALDETLGDSFSEMNFQN